MWLVLRPWSRHKFHLRGGWTSVGLHGVTCQRKVLLMVTAVRTSNPTKLSLCLMNYQVMTGYGDLKLWLYWVLNLAIRWMSKVSVVLWPPYFTGKQPPIHTALHFYLVPRSRHLHEVYKNKTISSLKVLHTPSPQSPIHREWSINFISIFSAIFSTHFHLHVY
jgi:hypothetical protein